MKKLSILVILICAIACTHKTAPPPISITLINNHTLKFTGLDPTITGEISRDTAALVWQSLIPVYRMPADTDMKDYQSAQPGKYQITGNVILFTPDTPFAKNQMYFARCYQYGSGHSIWDQIQTRKKLGKHQYTDLIFKQ